MGIVERREREKDMQKRMRRRQILDAAKRVFHNKGFSAATVEDIAQEAELSPAALYLYFKNKDDIYVSLNLQLLEYLSDSLEKLYRQEGIKPDEKLITLKDVLYDVFQFDPLILINLFHLQCENSITARVYDVMACGSFLLSQSTPALEETFRVGEELETFKTPGELYEKVRYYLANPSERLEIARRGQAVVMNRHTPVHRLRTILNDLGWSQRG